MLENNNMQLEVSEVAVNWLAQHGYDPVRGKTPKRLIQKTIVNELSRRIIAGRIQKDNTVKIDVVKDHLDFTGRKS
jgi:ATP-dependent Clp protease ATP-binding subunit ClpB